MKRIFVVLIFIGLTSLQAVANGTGTAQSDIEKLMDKIKLECKGGLKKFGESEVFGEFQMSKSFHEFTMLTEANIDYTLNDFLEIAPDRESQIIFMQAFLQYSPREFLKVLSTMVKLRAENKIEDDVFQILIFPAKTSKNEYFFSLNYRDPRVRKILREISALYKNDADLCNFSKNYLSGKFYWRDYILINQRLNRETMYLPFLSPVMRKSFIRAKRIVKSRSELKKHIKLKELTKSQMEILAYLKNMIQDVQKDISSMGRFPRNPQKMNSYKQLCEESNKHWRFVLEHLSEIAGTKIGGRINKRWLILGTMLYLPIDESKQVLKELPQLYEEEKITDFEFSGLIISYFLKAPHEKEPIINHKSYFTKAYSQQLKVIFDKSNDALYAELYYLISK